jgi:hypothetical protein
MEEFDQNKNTKIEEFDYYGEAAEILGKNWIIKKEVKEGFEGIIVSIFCREKEVTEDSIASIGICDLSKKGKIQKKVVPIVYEIDLPLWIAKSVYKQMKNKKVRLNEKLRPLLVEDN